MKTSLLAALLLLLSPALRAQFILNGQAAMVNDSCYLLTEAVNAASGSIWHPIKIDLGQSFEVVMDIFLGCQDEWGADGIVFGFQPLSTSIGQAGGGLGFQGIRPSLGIEFDTWQNTTAGDPIYDHIAIFRDGNLNHNSPDNLAGPVPALPNQRNIEDCAFHSLRVNWEADIKKLSVYFDCLLRLTYEGDIVNDIFRGDPEVFWGFTAATGAANNLHQVCFSYVSFLNRLDDVVLCPGGQVQLQTQGGISYQWSPPEGLSNPNIANPIAAPAVSTDYAVTIRDACGIPFYDSLRVEVAGDSVFFSLGPADTAICEGTALLLDAASSSSAYQWNTGAQTPSLLATEPGIYIVTVTKTDTFCIAEGRIDISVIPLPRLNLGPDTALCQGQSILLRSDFTAAQLRWQDGSTADTLLANRSGWYELTAENACGMARDVVRVEVESCREAYIPNAFSPNDDGRNDYFYIQSNGDVERVLLLRIFDRWGGLLFEAKDSPPDVPGRGWDGTSGGKLLNPGTYVFLAHLAFRDGAMEIRQGEVMLVR
jgi:gliding motility-associated-like protein